MSPALASVYVQIHTHSLTRARRHFRMLRRAWKPILGAAALVAPPAYIYYRYRNPTFSGQRERKGTRRQGAHGQALLPLAPLALRRPANQRIYVVRQPPPSEGLVWKHTTAHVASNDPIEDTHAQAVITTEPTSFRSRSPPSRLFRHGRTLWFPHLEAALTRAHTRRHPELCLARPATKTTSNPRLCQDLILHS